MIRSLRRTHRWIATGLAIALPVSYAAILWSRPAVMSLPVIAGQALPDVTGTPGLRARVERHANDRPTVTLAMTGAAPDLLVYWSPARQALPGDGAVLLGSLLPQMQTRVLPDVAGYLLIYSVAIGATQAVVSVASLEGAR